MGGSQSREGLDLSDYESDSDSQTGTAFDDYYHDVVADVSSKTLENIDTKLQKLKIKELKTLEKRRENAVKLYLHVGGNTTQGKWIVAEK
ncbi:hypothetical protein AgCh_024774 [Apium graveolens]